MFVLTYLFLSDFWELKKNLDSEYSLINEKGC